MKAKALLLIALLPALSLAGYARAQTRIQTNYQQLLQANQSQTQNLQLLNDSNLQNKKIEDVQVLQNSNVINQELWKKQYVYTKDRCSKFNGYAAVFKYCLESANSTEACDKSIASYFLGEGEEVSADLRAKVLEKVKGMCPNSKTSCECAQEIKKAEGLSCPLPDACETRCDLSKEDIDKLGQYAASRESGTEDPSLKEFWVKSCGSSDKEALIDEKSQEKLAAPEEIKNYEEVLPVEGEKKLEKLSSGVRVHQLDSYKILNGRLGADPLCSCLSKHSCPVLQCQGSCLLSSSQLLTLAKYEKACKTNKDSTDCKAVETSYQDLCGGKSPDRCRRDAMCYSPDDKVCDAANTASPGGDLITVQKEGGELQTDNYAITKAVPPDDSISGSKMCSFTHRPVHWGIAVFMALLLEALPLLGMGFLRLRKR